MAINGNGSNGKYPARASLSEVSRGYNLDGGGDFDEVFDETESKRTGHTRNDQKDMSRMGKRQELIVSFRLHSHSYFFFFLRKENTTFLFSFLFGVLLKIQNHSLINSISLSENEQRNFRPLSALSFAVVLQATWEFLLM